MKFLGDEAFDPRAVSGFPGTSLDISLELLIRQSMALGGTGVRSWKLLQDSGGVTGPRTGQSTGGGWTAAGLSDGWRGCSEPDIQFYGSLEFCWWHFVHATVVGVVAPLWLPLIIVLKFQG